MPEYTPNIGLAKRLPGEKYSRPQDNDNLDKIDAKCAHLDTNGKIPADMLPNSVMEYHGTWNAATNTPALANGTGNAGDVYRVTVAGTQNLGSGNITFSIGDYAIYNGNIWEKSRSSETIPAANVPYNNTTSGLIATTAQGAIDDLANKFTPINIPSGADLNDYTSPGNYYVATSATAGTIANSPWSITGFAMNVIQTGTNLRMQIMYCGTPVNSYIKTRALQYSSGVWSYGDWIDLPIMRSATPTPTSAGTIGQMAVDSDFLYICIATNTWRRVALSTW